MCFHEFSISREYFDGEFWGFGQKREGCVIQVHLEGLLLPIVDKNVYFHNSANFLVIRSVFWNTNGFAELAKKKDQKLSRSRTDQTRSRGSSE